METVTADVPEVLPVAGIAAAGESTDEERATEVSRRAEIARKQAELRTALNAAASITDPRKRNETLSQICYHWAEFDPRGAVALACDFRLDGPGVLENLTQQWANADLPAAREWVDAQPHSDTKARIVARIGFLWAQSEPGNAANYILNEIPPGEIQTEAAISVLHQWAQRDHQAALTWARTFPAGELRERALREALPPPVSGGGY